MNINKGETILVIGNLDGDVEFNNQVVSVAYDIGKLKNKKVLLIDLSRKTDEEVSKYFNYGADYIIKISNKDLDMKQIKEVLYKEIKEIEPAVIITGSNKKNKEVASSIATKIEAGLVADCINIRKSNESDRMIFSRAAINSTVVADISCSESDVEMCTIKKDCFKAKLNKDEEGLIESIAVNVDDYQKSNIELIDKVLNEDLEESLKLNSRIMIGIGRGAVNSMDSIKHFAELLNADIGCTRPLVDNGVMPYSQQIGQSGKSVKPDVYIMLGISGASQHVVGITNAKRIIAVNMDDEAPIKNYCDYFINSSIDDFISCVSKKLI